MALLMDQFLAATNMIFIGFPIRPLMRRRYYHEGLSLGTIWVCGTGFRILPHNNRLREKLKHVDILACGYNLSRSTIHAANYPSTQIYIGLSALFYILSENSPYPELHSIVHALCCAGWMDLLRRSTV